MACKQRGAPRGPNANEHRSARAAFARGARGRTLAVPALVVAATMACTPATNSENACWSANLTLTSRGDANLVEQYHSGIDGPMQTLMDTSGAPSCAIAVVAGNRVVTLNRYGDPIDIGGAPLDPDSPALSQTRLYVGSISKTITALAMLALAEDDADGGFTDGGPPATSLLDRRLSDLYPPAEDTPEWADLTTRSLLAHATGTRKDPSPADDDALDDLPAAAGPFPGIHPRHAFVVYRDSTPRVLGFNQQYTARYSNVGYALVGTAIDWQTVEAVAGDQPGYERFAFRNVALNDGRRTDPSMLSLCLGTPWRAPHMDNLARGYAAGSNVPLPAPNFSGWEGPAGGWTMTIGDLGRLIVLINTHARITPSSTDEMFEAIAKGPVSDPNDWGLGIWHTSDGADEDRYGKGGDITGFTSDFIAYRSAGVGAAVVCNQSGVSHGALRDAIREIIDPCRATSLAGRPEFCSPSGIGG